MNEFQERIMEYNTQRRRLPLPEYGRGVQNMVNHALTIEDKAERQRCAQTIINIMGGMFPHLRDVPDFKHKLWDHLAMMSDFKLDIDYPCEIISAENLDTTPEKIEHQSVAIKYRHYGKYIEQMVAKIATLEEGEEKNALTLLVANHMKKMMLAINKDGVEDSKIFKDLYEYSSGQINLNESEIHLHEFKEIVSSSNSKKKKKK